MTRTTASLWAAAAMAMVFTIQGTAQDRPAAATAPPQSTDPRASLKAGFRDAGQVARHLELVSTMPKPSGFFDPKAPAGSPAAPRTGRRGGGAANAAAPAATTDPAAATTTLMDGRFMRMRIRSFRDGVQQSDIRVLTSDIRYEIAPVMISLNFKV